MIPFRNVERWKFRTFEAKTRLLMMSNCDQIQIHFVIECKYLPMLNPSFIIYKWIWFFFIQSRSHCIRHSSAFIGIVVRSDQSSFSVFLSLFFPRHTPHLCLLLRSLSDVIIATTENMKKKKTSYTATTSDLYTFCAWFWFHALFDCNRTEPLSEGKH